MASPKIHTALPRHHLKSRRVVSQSTPGDGHSGWVEVSFMNTGGIPVTRTATGFLRGILLPLLATALCVGCVEIEETITLKKDGSGEVHLEATFPQLAMRWLPGKPNADWLRPNLPDGVRLASYENAQSKTTITDPNGNEHKLESERYEFDFSFDDVTALNHIRFRPDSRNEMAAAAGGTPGREGTSGMSAQGNAPPEIGPFQNLTLKKEGDLLHFRRVVQAARNPDDIAASMMNAPGAVTKPEVVDLGDSALKISILCPGEIAEHNADRVEGRTLTWEFKLKELQERQDRDWVVEFTCRREGKS